MVQQQDFREVAHCGGQIIIQVRVDQAGRQVYQLTLQGSRPVAAAYFCVYAIPAGIVLSQVILGA